MIAFKSGLSKKEKQEIVSLLYELKDVYGDFYITRNNLRLFIKENPDTLFDCLKKGDFIAFTEKGVGIVTGFSDKSNRKYLKILAQDDATVSDLIKVISWNTKCDLHFKIKKNNPLKKVLERNGFRFCGDRGKEILLCKKVRVQKTPNKGDINRVNKT